MIPDFFARAFKSVWFERTCYLLFATFLIALVYRTFLKEKPADHAINMSCFAFRDVNRNGIFDTEDRPFAGLEVTMYRPKGKSITRRSNLGGFTNFEMQKAFAEADISHPGTYSIKVTSPEGWSITTDNVEQSFNIRELPDSPTGLVGDHTYSPVGVAPQLSISGQVTPSAQNTELTIAHSDGPPSGINVEEDGSYAFHAARGSWTLFANDVSNGTSLERTIQLGNYPVVVSILQPNGQTPQGLTREKTIDFDHLTPSDTIYEIPNGYSGFNWSNWVAVHHKHYQSESHINATISSEYLAYSSSGHPMVLWSDNHFDFAGAYFSSVSESVERGEIKLRAWRGKELVYEDSFRSRSIGPLYFDADYRSINKLEVSHSSYWNVYVDDLHLRVNQH